MKLMKTAFFTVLSAFGLKDHRGPELSTNEIETLFKSLAADQVPKCFSQIKDFTNIRDKFGESVLHRAAADNNIPTTLYLIKNHPNLIEILDGASCSVLDNLIATGNEKLACELAKELSPETINKKITSNGESLLHLTIKNGHSFQCYAAPVLQLLINKTGVNVHSLTDSKDNALILAATVGNAEAVRILLKAGIDKDHKNNTGNTAVHRAAEEGWPSVLQILIDYNCRTQTKNNDGKIPFDLISEKSKKLSPELIIMLKNGQEETLLPSKHPAETKILEIIKHDLGGNKLPETLKSLESPQTWQDQHGQTLLHYSATEGNEPTTEYLMDKYPQLITTLDAQSISALDTAISNGKERVAKYIARKISTRTIETPLTAEGENLFHLTIKNGDKNHELVRSIIDIFVSEKKININSVATISHNNALIFAAQTANLSVTKLLVEKDISKDHKNSVKNTAVHIATKRGDQSVLEILVEYGCPTETKNKKNKTPFDVIPKNQHEEFANIIQILKNAQTTKTPFWLIGGGVFIGLCWVTSLYLMGKLRFDTIPFISTM